MESNFTHVGHRRAGCNDKPYCKHTTKDLVFESTCTFYGGPNSRYAPLHKRILHDHSIDLGAVPRGSARLAVGRAVGDEHAVLWRKCGGIGDHVVAIIHPKLLNSLVALRDVPGGPDDSFLLPGVISITSQ